MIDINLYQPGVVNESIQFPSLWNEFYVKELHLISKSILSNFKDAAQANAALFLMLLKMRCGRKVKNIEKRLDPEDAVINGLQVLDFIYKGNDLTKQPYPTLKLPPANRLLKSSDEFYGPADDFNSLTCGEFEDAELFFNQFKEDPTAKSLANLASVLYRPKSVSYLQFNVQTNSYINYDAEKMQPRFNKLKPWILYTIFLWYAGCREQLPKIFPNCFGSPKQEGEETREIDFMIFTKCIHAGAGPKNGTREKIRTTLLKEFFFDIELENIRAQELQNEIDAAK